MTMTGQFDIPLNPCAKVFRIKNGFLVQVSDGVVYCDNSEAIASVIISTLVKDKLMTGQQLELPFEDPAINSI